MKKIEIVQFKDQIMNNIEDTVAEECILNLKINSEISFDVIVSPEMIKEFVYGNLYTEGFIRAKEDIVGYSQQIKENLVQVAVEIAEFSKRKVFFRKNYNIVWTECGSGSEIRRLSDQMKPLITKLQIKAQDILEISGKIKDKIILFKQTGAFHYAFLFDKNMTLENHAYDIGRHNAVDKVVGGVLLNSGILDDKILFITGRISSDIIMKCLRAKIPFVISRGAPLATAVELAKKYKICLIGFLRGKRFNIYSNHEAIIQ